MRLYDLKEYLHDLVSRYFQQATVIWANEVSTKPSLPLVMLRLGNLSRQSFPLEDGSVRYYGSTIDLEIQIFSKGGKIGGGYSDDTVADLNEFLLYLESPEITDELFNKDLAIDIGTPVQSIPALLGEAKNEFRAMVELTVNFTQETAGAYDLKQSEKDPEEWTPTSAGGGSIEQVSEENEFIEHIEFEEEYDGKHDRWNCKM